MDFLNEQSQEGREMGRWAWLEHKGCRDFSSKCVQPNLIFYICYSYLVCRSSLIYVTDNTIETALAMENIHAL